MPQTFFLTFSIIRATDLRQIYGTMTKVLKIPYLEIFRVDEGKGAGLEMAISMEIVIKVLTLTFENSLV